MFYDLHMHSCLSPCAEDEMTPNNICNMALIKGLDVIALTDHNSTKQLSSISKVAKSLNLNFIYGCEIQTVEEVHILGLFDSLEKTERLQKWIDKHKAQMPGVDIWMALGATIDFEAGNIKRAPIIWRKLCMEWFYRFLQEPQRMYKRYFIDDPKFFWYLLKQMLGFYKNPFEPKE